MRQRTPPSKNLTAPHPGSGALWRRWVLYVSVGELVGFTAPGVIGAWTQGLSTGSQLPLLVIGGCLEGAALGFAQALVLRRVWPGFKVHAWIGATAAAAGFAWLLGMLPATTHSIWSTWSPAWVALAGIALGVMLLASIGTAQALVMPPETARPHTWIGWTALGWCAGLTAFSAVAPPLWHDGQPPWQLVLIGIAGGTAMAAAMAAVTGIGVLRFTRRAVANTPGADHLAGSRTLSSLLGTPVFDPEGEPAGTLRDLVVDLAAGPGGIPVTGVLLARRGQPDRLLAWGSLAERHGLPGLALTPLGDGTWTSRPTEVLARRDILDSPVVIADPPRRARVSDVVLELDPAHATVSGLDISTTSALRRLLGQAPVNPSADTVPLSGVHVVSSQGHKALLATPDALVFRLTPEQMAEVLTRLSVSHARDILDVADRQVVDQALPLLHPHVRGRLTGATPAPRRTRRLGGWLLRRPRQESVPGPDPRS